MHVFRQAYFIRLKICVHHVLFGLLCVQAAFAGRNQASLLSGTCNPTAQIRTAAMTLGMQAGSRVTGTVPAAAYSLLEEWMAFSEPTVVNMRRSPSGLKLILHWTDPASPEQVALEVTWDAPDGSQPRVEFEDARPHLRRLHLPPGTSLRTFGGGGHFIYHSVLVGSRYHPFSLAYLENFTQQDSASYTDDVRLSIQNLNDAELLSQLTRALGERTSRLITPASRMNILVTSTPMNRNQDFSTFAALFYRRGEVGGYPPVVGTFLTDVLTSEVDTFGAPSIAFLRRVKMLHGNASLWQLVMDNGVAAGISRSSLDLLVEEAQAIDWTTQAREPWENLPGGRVLTVLPGGANDEMMRYHSPEFRARARSVNEWIASRPVGFPAPMAGGMRPGSPTEVLASLNFYLRSSLGLPVAASTVNTFRWQAPGPPVLLQERVAAYFLALLTPAARTRLVQHDFLPETAMRRLIDHFTVADPDLPQSEIPLLQPRAVVRPAARREPRANRSAPIVTGVDAAQAVVAPSQPQAGPVSVEPVQPSNPSQIADPESFSMPALPPASRAVVTNPVSIQTAIQTGLFGTLQWIARAKHLLHAPAPLRPWELRTLNTELHVLLRSRWMMDANQYTGVVALQAVIASAFTNAELRRLGQSVSTTTGSREALHWPTIETAGSLELGNEPTRSAVYREMIAMSHRRIAALVEAADQGDVNASLELYGTLARWTSGLMIPDDERLQAQVWVIGTWFNGFSEDMRRRLFPAGRPMGADFAVRTRPVPAAVATPAIAPRPAIESEPLHADAVLESEALIREALTRRLSDLAPASDRLHISRVFTARVERPRGEPGPRRDPYRVLEEAIEFENEIHLNPRNPAQFSVRLDDYLYTFQGSGNLPAAISLMDSGAAGLQLIRISYDPVAVDESEMEESDPTLRISGRASSPTVTSLSLPTSVEGSPHRVVYASAIQRDYVRRRGRGYPANIRAALRLLGADLCRTGLQQREWANYSVLRHGRHHAHLLKNGVGNFYWVAIWHEGPLEVDLDGTQHRVFVIERVIRREHVDRYLNP